MYKILTFSNVEMLENLTKYNINGIIVGQIGFSNRFNRYFDKNELIDLSSKCKNLGLDLYINLNNIFFEQDIVKVEENLKFLKTLNLKGIYFNDLAIFSIAIALEMEHLLIYHPDTLLTNTLDIKFYLDKKLKGIVLSNEITLDDIKLISSNIDKGLHLIMHGRINLSYSRRRFIKTYFEQINKKYDYDNQLNLSLIESTRENKMPILENEDGTSIFSDFTLQSFEELSSFNVDTLIIDDIFMDEAELVDTLKLYNNEILLEEFTTKYQHKNYSSGFYYQKTNLVK